jgi:hypothetical protein
MGSYGGYPNPQLCSKYGAKKYWCSVCAFFKDCPVLKENKNGWLSWLFVKRERKRRTVKKNL